MIEAIRSAVERFFVRPVPRAGELEPPDDDVIRLAGFDDQTLRSRGILPQTSAIASAGYALVVADPNVLAVREFEAAGVQVLLADAREIERAWEARDVKPIPPSRKIDVSSSVTEVLRRIVADCAALGAEEVFLGHPSDCDYEGIAQGKRFSGFVHRRVFAECLAAVRRAGELALDSKPPCRAALTRNFDRPIVCLTWTLPPEPVRIIETSARTVSVPQPAAPRNADLPEPGCRETSAPARILLVEDDDRFAAVLASILRARGFEVTRAPNGAQALALLDTGTDYPELVISDVHMPVCDGRAFVSSLREKQNSVPVLMLTSDDDKLLEADLVLLGANAYVRKSDDPRVLLAWIQNLLCARGGV